MSGLNRNRKKKIKIQQLSERQNHRCCYCGVKTWIIQMEDGLEPQQASLEHVQPQSEGGLWTWDNLVMACRECNSARKSKPAYIFWYTQTYIGYKRRSNSGKTMWWEPLAEKT